jgi:hypothetical protein
VEEEEEEEEDAIAAAADDDDCLRIRATPAFTVGLQISGIPSSTVASTHHPAVRSCLR